jgi:WhiB family redox-sensing transcriptional regulator
MNRHAEGDHGLASPPPPPRSGDAGRSPQAAATATLSLTRESTNDVTLDDDWAREAACTSHDPELFFPIGGSRPALLQIEQAQRICSTCPVRTSCLEWALGIGVEFGVWGGMSEEDRRAVARRRCGAETKSAAERARTNWLREQSRRRREESQLRTATAAKKLEKLRFSNQAVTTHRWLGMGVSVGPV